MPAQAERIRSPRVTTRIPGEITVATEAHLTPNITTYRGILAALDWAHGGEKPIPFGSIALWPGNKGELEELYAIVSRQSEDSVEARIDRIAQKCPKEDAFIRWVGAQMMKLSTVRTLMSSSKNAGRPTRSKFNSLVFRFCQDMTAELKTPDAWREPPPPGEVLKEKKLQEVYEVIQLCEEPGSVVEQLRVTNTLRLGLWGLQAKTTVPDGIYKPNYDLSVLKSLLEILGTLKHKQSETVLKAWVTKKLNGTLQDASAAVLFLELLANATFGQDLESMSKLLKPPPVAEERKPEILTHPFIALKDVIRAAQTTLKLKTRHELLAGLEATEKLVGFRYGQVFRGTYRTSLFTADARALIPRPDDFAHFAKLCLEMSDGTLDKKQTAQALIKMAESANINDIGPLAATFQTGSELSYLLNFEAQKRGLIPFPNAEIYIARFLKEIPWLDAADMDYSDYKIIKPGVRILKIYFFPGSFAPWTKGHEDNVSCGIAYLRSLPSATPDGRGIQRAVMITPITRTANVKGYEKATAQVGPIDVRAGSILLGSGDEFDRSEVWVTLKLQPDPSQAIDLHERIVTTFNGTSSVVRQCLNRAGRLAGIELEWHYLCGPEEYAWVNNHQELAPRDKQTERAIRPGGILVTRPGWNYQVITNHRAIETITGAEAIIVSPGTYSSSTSAIKELHRMGGARAIKQTAQSHFAQNWSSTAISIREKVSAARVSSTTVYTAPSFTRVGQRHITSVLG